MTAKFFGEDFRAVESAQTQAVAFELTNNVCGSALSVWCPEGHFDLQAPQAPSPAEPDPFEPPLLKLLYDLETGKLEIRFWVN